MNWPVHSYGTQNIPSMVSQMGQMMFKKREGERQDKKDLLKLVETRKNTAFDQGYKLLQIYDKYADTAPEAGKKIANQSTQFFKAAGYEFDLSTIADAAEGKKLLQSQTVEKMEQLSEGLFQTGQVDLKGAVNQPDQSTITDQKINILTRFIRQAKQSGVDKEVTDIYEKHIAEARKRQAANLVEDRKIKAEERAEGRKTPTGLVGQFYEMHKRMPKNIEELKTFKENLRLPPQTTEKGTLTENQVAQSLLDTASGMKGDFDKNYSKLYDNYRKKIASGKTREVAYNEVLKEATGNIPTTGKPTTFNYLWE